MRLTRGNSQCQENGKCAESLAPPTQHTHSPEPCLSMMILGKAKANLIGKGRKKVEDDLLPTFPP
jgi:hypothetical protein